MIRRHFTTQWPAWIAVLVAVGGIVFSGGILSSRVAYCEKEISELSGVPVQVGRIEERQIGQQAQLDRIERSLARQRGE